MADSVRILAIYNGVSWMSEIIPDLIKLYKFLGRLEALNPILLDEALVRLESEGIITMEERVRGSFTYPGTFMDKIIHLVDLNATLKVLSRDQTFLSYVHERHRRMREALNI